SRQRRFASARRTRSSMAFGPDDATWRRHHTRDRASLWARRVPATCGTSVLVPILWRRDGHGLALVRYHHEGDRRAQTWSEAARKRTWAPCGRRARKVLPPNAAGTRLDRGPRGI